MRSKARARRIIQRKPGCISKGELVSGMRNLQCQPQIVFDFCPICSTHRVLLLYEPPHLHGTKSFSKACACWVGGQQGDNR